MSYIPSQLLIFSISLTPDFNRGLKKQIHRVASATLLILCLIYLFYNFIIIYNTC